MSACPLDSCTLLPVLTYQPLLRKLAALDTLHNSAILAPLVKPDVVFLLVTQHAITLELRKQLGHLSWNPASSCCQLYCSFHRCLVPFPTSPDVSLVSHAMAQNMFCSDSKMRLKGEKSCERISDLIREERIINGVIASRSLKLLCKYLF